MERLVLPVVDSDVPLLPARNPPKSSFYDLLPLLRIFKPVIGLFRRQVSPVNEGGKRSIMGHKKYMAHVEVRCTGFKRRRRADVVGVVERSTRDHPILVELSRMATQEGAAHARDCDRHYEQHRHAPGVLGEPSADPQYAAAVCLPGASAHVAVVSASPMIYARA